MAQPKGSSSRIMVAFLISTFSPLHSSVASSVLPVLNLDELGLPFSTLAYSK